MTAEVKFMNLRSNLWRERDGTDNYMKCVFFNTQKFEFVFTDLNSAVEDEMCVFLTKDYQIRYLKNGEAAAKIFYWMDMKQDTVVARQDEVIDVINQLMVNPDAVVPLPAEKFVPVEF